ncbi:MAG: hypothetical protein ABWY27_15765 [Telluria sp.]
MNLTRSPLGGCVEPRKFKQFIDQAARLSRRQRADLANRLNRSLL